LLAVVQRVEIVAHVLKGHESIVRIATSAVFASLRECENGVVFGVDGLTLQIGAPSDDIETSRLLRGNAWKDIARLVLNFKHNRGQQSLR